MRKLKVIKYIGKKVSALEKYSILIEIGQNKIVNNELKMKSLFQILSFLAFLGTL